MHPSSSPRQAGDWLSVHEPPRACAATKAVAPRKRSTAAASIRRTMTVTSLGPDRALSKTITRALELRGEIGVRLLHRANHVLDTRKRALVERESDGRGLLAIQLDGAREETERVARLARAREELGETRGDPCEPGQVRARRRRGAARPRIPRAPRPVPASLRDERAFRAIARPRASCRAPIVGLGVAHVIKRAIDRAGLRVLRRAVERNTGEEMMRRRRIGAGGRIRRRLGDACSEEREQRPASSRALRCGRCEARARPARSAASPLRSSRRHPSARQSLPSRPPRRAPRTRRRRSRKRCPRRPPRCPPEASAARPHRAPHALPARLSAPSRVNDGSTPAPSQRTRARRAARAASSEASSPTGSARGSRRGPLPSSRRPSSCRRPERAPRCRRGAPNVAAGSRAEASSFTIQRAQEGRNSDAAIDSARFDGRASDRPRDRGRQCRRRARAAALRAIVGRGPQEPRRPRPKRIAGDRGRAKDSAHAGVLIHAGARGGSDGRARRSDFTKSLGRLVADEDQER